MCSQCQQSLENARAALRALGESKIVGTPRQQVRAATVQVADSKPAATAQEWAIEDTPEPMDIDVVSGFPTTFDDSDEDFGPDHWVWTI